MPSRFSIRKKASTKRTTPLRTPRQRRTQKNKAQADLAVGRVAGLFGIRGELKCDPTSAGRALFVRDAGFRVELEGGAAEDVRLASVREHGSRLLIRIAGADSADAAQGYVGARFFAARERINLEPGEYLDRDLQGCVLYDPSGTSLGTVAAVEHYPASDMLVVNGKLVPLIHEFIKEIDISSKRIVAELPPGLIDEP